MNIFSCFKATGKTLRQSCSILVLAVMPFLSGYANALTAIYYTNGVSGSGAYNYFAGVAQQFKTDSKNLQLIEIEKLFDAGNVSILADASDAPGANLGVSFSQAWVAGWNTYTPTTLVTLSANTKYWVAGYGGSETAPDYITGSGFLANTYVSNDYGSTTSPTWSTAGLAVTMKIWMDTAPVPEPNSSILLVLGLLAIVVVRKSPGIIRNHIE